LKHIKEDAPTKYKVCAVFKLVHALERMRYRLIARGRGLSLLFETASDDERYADEEVKRENTVQKVIKGPQSRANSAVGLWTKRHPGTAFTCRP
jgi:hypothetical protein